MTCKEQQEEELEVLRSIYEGDESFKEVSPTVFQYKYGEENSCKAFMLELTWGDSYPEVPPAVSMDAFYNKHILDSVKKGIVDGVLEQAQEFLETAMTYTLFEWVKENYDSLVTDQPDTPPTFTQIEEKESKPVSSTQEVSKKKEKKEQLTKHQKRRMYEKSGNATGEKQRGWNWVDVIKHLSQTGSQNN